MKLFFMLMHTDMECSTLDEAIEPPAPTPIPTPVTIASPVLPALQQAAAALNVYANAARHGQLTPHQWAQYQQLFAQVQVMTNSLGNS